MSDTTSPDVQFDRAEPMEGAGAPGCGLCQEPLAGTFYETNGQPTCASCHDVLRQAHAGSAGLRGVIVAVVAALGAGIAGALLYYAVLAFTGYEIGLIAIVVGWLVGSAARWGSGGRGGRAYQAIAMSVTYVAIVSTYVPFIFAGAPSAPATPDGTPTDTAVHGPATPDDATPSAAVTPPAADSPEAVTSPSASEEPPLTPLGFLKVLGILSLIVLASPFLAGFDNVIGWLIIGFALYEAWKLTRRVTLEITGPYALPATAMATPEPLPPDTAAPAPAAP